jgi:outer membrane protein
MLWLLLPSLGIAGSPVDLSLQQAIETALLQNPSVMAARYAVESADARIRQARAGYYPQFGFNGIAKAGLSGATNALGLVGLPASPLYRNFADSLNASQSVLDFGRTRHQVAYERKLRDAAEADVAAVEAEVTLEVERAYYGLLRAHRLRDVAAEIVRAREATVRQAQAFYEEQVRSRVDLDLARVNLSRAQLQATDAENRVHTAVAKLGQALGGAQDGEYVLEPPEPSLPRLESVDSLIHEAMRTRPELQASHFEREAAEERLEFIRSQKKPLLNLAFSGGYARFTNILARELLAGGAGLALPLFTGGRIEGQEEESEAQMRVLVSREESLKQRVALEIRTAWFGLKKALDAVPVLRLEMEYARSALRLTAERYRERLGSFVDLTAAQSGLEEASAGEAVGFYDVTIAESELRRAIGRR